MQRYGLLGEKLGHSYSPQIHAQLASYPYDLYEVAPERLDAFLLAIWFFTLFALINVFLFYAEQLIAAIAGLMGKIFSAGTVDSTEAGDAETVTSKKDESWQKYKMYEKSRNKVWTTVAAVIFVFVVAECFCYGSFAEWFESYTAYVAVPLLILLPLIIALWGKAKKHGTKNS